MLMMLAGLGHVGKNQGQLTLMLLAALWEPATADAHDAYRVWPSGANQGQLMLMMLAGLGHVGKTRGS